MHNDNPDTWQHSHTFGQDLKRPGELRTVIVIVITGAMMIVEIVAGILFGSMALLADGLHMASHAGALSINAFAYVYARRHARDARFSFGTGKVNTLGGFSGALLLALFSLLMVWESVHRLFSPVDIIFNHAIFVACLGFIVNGICVFILGGDGHRGHGRSPEHHSHHGHRHDHNLRSAYLHVLADALTSVLAIFALIAGKYLAFVWMDPLMGVVGAVLVARWSVGLLCVTSGVLLDQQGPDEIRKIITESIENDHDSKVVDLHVWSIGPNIYAVILAVVAHEPESPEGYRARIPKDLGLDHIAIEVRQCPP